MSATPVKRKDQCKELCSLPCVAADPAAQYIALAWSWLVHGSEWAGEKGYSRLAGRWMEVIPRERQVGREWEVGLGPAVIQNPVPFPGQHWTTLGCSASPLEVEQIIVDPLSCCHITRNKEKSFSCPTIAQQQPRTRVGQPTCLYERKLGLLCQALGDYISQTAPWIIARELSEA